jgi:hypothetical protein
MRLLSMKPDAVRKRRCRARSQAGTVRVEIEFTPADTATLYDVGCLDLDGLEDPKAIARAVLLLLANIHRD